MIADIRDAVIQNTMVKPRGRNICPVIPPNMASGRNTTQVVSVEPITDWYTTPVPFRAALENSRNPVSSVALKQLSSTTVELSTIIPTPSTRALRVITLRLKPMSCISMRDDRMDTGMELPTIIDAFRSPKNSQMMTMEMIMASTIVSITELRDDMMESLSSSTMVICRLGSLAVSSFTTRFTSFETFRVAASCCLLTVRATISSGSPFSAL